MTVLFRPHPRGIYRNYTEYLEIELFNVFRITCKTYIIYCICGSKNTQIEICIQFPVNASGETFGGQSGRGRGVECSMCVLCTECPTFCSLFVRALEPTTQAHSEAVCSCSDVCLLLLCASLLRNYKAFTYGTHPPRTRPASGRSHPRCAPRAAQFRAT